MNQLWWNPKTKLTTLVVIITLQRHPQMCSTVWIATTRNAHCVGSALQWVNSLPNVKRTAAAKPVDKQALFHTSRMTANDFVETSQLLNGRQSDKKTKSSRSAMAFSFWCQKLANWKAHFHTDPLFEWVDLGLASCCGRFTTQLNELKRDHVQQFNEFEEQCKLGKHAVEDTVTSLSTCGFHINTWTFAPISMLDTCLVINVWELHLCGKDWLMGKHHKTLESHCACTLHVDNFCTNLLVTQFCWHAWGQPNIQLTLRLIEMSDKLVCLECSIVGEMIFDNHIVIKNHLIKFCFALIVVSTDACQNPCWNSILTGNNSKLRKAHPPLWAALDNFSMILKFCVAFLGTDFQCWHKHQQLVKKNEVFSHILTVFVTPIDCCLPF